MKLSEKALKKIEDEMERGEYQIPCGYENVEGMSIYHLEEYEFEPDDFTGAVILTIEEAKQVKTFLDDAIKLHDKGIVVIQSTGFNTIQLIKDRIKQAEKSYEVK